MQTDKGQPLLWQNHPEIYTRTKKRVYQMKKILIENGYDVKVFESFLSFLDDIQYNDIKFDLVFYAIESCFNRNTNGFIPSLLEMNGIPFVGNDSYINTISSDKFLLNHIAASIGITVPKSILITKDLWIQNRKYFSENVEIPCILKYRYGSMSYDTYKVTSQSAFIEYVNFMLSQENGPVLCEEYISGKELSVPVIGNPPSEEILSIVEYTNETGKPLEIYDFLWKGKLDKYVTLWPIDKTESYVEIIKNSVHKLYCFLGFHDYARFDFRLSTDNIPFLLEVNPLPALAYESAFDPKSYGMKITFDEVINKIFDAAIKRNKIKRDYNYDDR